MNQLTTKHVYISGRVQGVGYRYSLAHQAQALFIVTALLLGLPAETLAAQQPAKPAPLQATITESHFLPPQMYGQWAVTATLVDTNVQDFFAPATRDLWLLEQTGNEVIIANPVTGASAAIGVDKVEGNTATFHRSVSTDPAHTITEQPTVTVDGNRLQGYTLIQYKVSKQGHPPRIYTGRYTIAAERISGARTRFGNQPPTGELDFEVEDLQPDPAMAKPKKSPLDAYFNLRN